MWKQIFDLIKKVATLTQDTQKNKTDIKTLQDNLTELAETVRQMQHEMQRDRENEAHEREKLLLRLEVALLRAERRTLTGKPDQPLLLENPDQPPPPAQ